jgi:hypothetical protein
MTDAGGLTLAGALGGTSATFSGALDVTNTIRTDGASNSILLRNGFTAVIRNPNNNTRDLQIEGDGVTATFKGNGNVGIGTSSPTSPLHVGTATSGNQKIQHWGEPGFVDNYGLILRGSSLDGVFKFYGLNNGTETTNPILSMNRSSGNVGIGTSSPSNFSGVGFTGPFLDIAGILQIKGTSANTLAAFQLGGDTYRKALIYTPVGTDTPYLAFGVATSGSSSSANEVMRITSGGNVGIGTSSPGSALEVVATGGGTCAIQGVNPNGTTAPIFQASSITTGSTSWYAYVAQSGNGSAITTNTMFVYGNGNIVNVNNSYGTLSDIKLKENIVDATPKLDDILKLKVRNFNLIGDKNKQIGFIAQEMEKIFPALIEETPDKDLDNNDLGTVTKTIKTSVLIPMLVKAIQELSQEVNELKAKLA